MVPDKVAYTSGEKKAEILGGIMLAVFAAVIIALMALGVSGGGNIIMLVVLLIIYGFCGVYPQGTNIMKKPESASDRDYHRVRRGCIIAKFVLCAAVFLLSMPIFG